ncbi:MAG: Dabb family protein, partial [Acidimicrobiales bacterium]|nr:Dabb family protein [Acidimicrobiales bacterium]
MIRHVVLLHWKPNTTPEQIQAVIDDLNALPADIPQLAGYSVGPDAGLAEGNADFVVIGEFATADHYKIYA